MISIDASIKLNAKHKKTLEKVFKNPIPSNIKWGDIEGLLNALGATIRKKSKTSGSKIHVLLKDRVATFDAPHPSSDTDKGAVKSVRKFLLRTGVVYETDEI